MRGTMMRFGLALFWFGSEFHMTLLTSLWTVLPTVYLVLLDVIYCLTHIKNLVCPRFILIIKVTHVTYETE